MLTTGMGRDARTIEKSLLVVPSATKGLCAWERILPFQQAYGQNDRSHDSDFEKAVADHEGQWQSDRGFGDGLPDRGRRGAGAVAERPRGKTGTEFSQLVPFFSHYSHSGSIGSQVLYLNFRVDGPGGTRISISVPSIPISSHRRGRGADQAPGWSMARPETGMLWADGCIEQMYNEPKGLARIKCPQPELSHSHFLSS